MCQPKAATHLELLTYTEAHIRLGLSSSRCRGSGTGRWQPRQSHASMLTRWCGWTTRAVSEIGIEPAVAKGVHCGDHLTSMRSRCVCLKRTQQRRAGWTRGAKRRDATSSCTRACESTTDLRSTQRLWQLPFGLFLHGAQGSSMYMLMHS